MPARVTSARLIGREGELAQLLQTLEKTTAGDPRLVVIGGESGVGKTRLLSALREEARSAGARVLSGDCLQVSDGELPYAPLVAALRPLVREEHPLLSQLTPGQRTELARLLPGLDPGPSAEAVGSDESAQTRLFEVLLEVLECLGRETPVVLALEDVHWADRSTRSFIGFLAQNVTNERVLTVLTYRTDELHRRHPLHAVLAELSRDARVERLTLEPFSREQVAQALEDILGARPEAGLLDRLYGRSEGNLLYLEELVAAGADGRGRAPASLRDALMLRIEPLAPESREVLSILAVGQRLDDTILGRAGGLSPVALREALRELVADHLVVVNAEGHYVFRHALLREIVSDDLLPGERTAAHRALADALIEAEAAGDGTPQTAASIAHHLYSAGHRTAALRASVRAAEAAEQAHAYGEAAALLERALELWERTPDAAAVLGLGHAELLAWAAEAHHGGGMRDRQETLLRAALAEVDPASNPALASRLMERLSVCERNLNRSREALATAIRGLELIGTDPTPERAVLLASIARSLMLQGRWREGARTAEEALELARVVGDSAAEISSLDALGVQLIALGDVAQGSARSAEAIALARAQGRPDAIGIAYLNLADSLHLRGEVEEAWRVAEEGRSIVARGRAGFWLRMLIAEMAIDCGEWSRADESLPRPDRHLVGVERLNANLRRAELALCRGEQAEAGQLLEAIAHEMGEATEPQYSGPYAALRAELHRRQGELDAARAIIEEALERIDVCTDDVARLARVAAAGIDIETDEAQRARDLNERIEERRALERVDRLLDRLRVAERAGGPVERAWCATGEAQAARANGKATAGHWRRAVERWESLRRPYLAARARVHEGEALLEAGDRRAAADTLEQARAACERMGARWLAAETDGLAGRARLALGGPERRARDSDLDPVDQDPFGLTQRERQVLAGLARGMTNREIANALFMAEKTASVHVSRILAKLGARTRTEAAAVAYRHGLNRADEG